MLTKKCSECGKPISKSMNICPYCGCPINSKTNSKFPQIAKKILYIIIGVIVLTWISVCIFNSTSVQSHIADAKQRKILIKASKQSFEEAKTAENNEDYLLSIEKYKEVDKEYKLYNKAQNKISELQNLYKNKMLIEAENYSQNKEYNKAIQNIDEVISNLGNSDELMTLKKKYTDLKTSQYTEVVVINKTAIPKNVDNWIFSNYISFDFSVTNNSDKPIKGIEGILIINDLFGKEILRINSDITGQTINVNDTVTIKNLGCACNEFIEEQMKVFSTDFSDMQFIYDVSKIVYTDGTMVICD